MASLKNTILKKDEEIERLQLLKGSVGGTLKPKPSSGSNKQLEADIQQPMDDHRHQNESDIAGADADSDEGLSDTSDSGRVPGTDTDGEGTKSSEKKEK